MAKAKNDWSSMRVKKILDEIRFLSGQKKSIEELLDNKKKRLYAYFDETGNTKCSTEQISAFVQTRTKVVYDIPAIKKAVKKELWKQFVETTYTLNKKEFGSVCKENGIDPKLFLSCFEKSQQVNESSLSELYDKGKLSLEDLEGCYDAQVTKTVAFRLKKGEDFTIGKS